MFDNAALMHTTDFSVRGGTEKTNYYVSASYAKQNGITYGSYMKRTTLRANLDSKVKDWLKIGLNQSAAYSENRANSNAGTATNDLYSPSTIASAWPRYWEPYTYADTKHQIWGSDSWGNLYDPLFLVDVRPSKGENFLYNGAAFVELTPVKGLTLRVQLLRVLHRVPTGQLPTLPNIRLVLAIMPRTSTTLHSSSVKKVLNIAQTHSQL